MLWFWKIVVHKGAATVYAADMPEHAIDAPPTRRVPVEEAAKILGLTANAVRKRVERGTLRSARDGDTRYVILDGDMSRPAADMPNDMPTDQALIVARLENEVGFLRKLVRSRDEELRRERDARKEAERRHDTIIMRMAERIPELEAPRGLQDGHETTTVEPDRVDARPQTAHRRAQSAARGGVGCSDSSDGSSGFRTHCCNLLIEYTEVCSPAAPSGPISGRCLPYRFPPIRAQGTRNACNAKDGEATR